MTIENEKNENSDNDSEDSVVENDKTNKIAEKLKKMGVMPSDKKSSEEKTSRFSPLLITVLLAIPAAGVVLYLYMPDQVNQFAKSLYSSPSVFDEQAKPKQLTEKAQEPVRQLASQNYQSEVNRWNRPPQPQWVNQQHADMEKRRLEFEKKSTANNRRSTSSPVETPQWVKDRQADIAKYQQQIEKYQQEMAKYQQEMATKQQQWAAEQASWINNRAQQQPGYMKHPQMNNYQQNFNGPNKQMQQANPNAVNPNQQNQRRHYNTYNYPPRPYFNNGPFYGPGSGPVPYGWRGYR
jgi:hypothetical protein